MKKHIAQLIVWICWSGTIVLAQSDRIKFERLSIGEGLSQSKVFSIYQDHKGFLWIGTMDGLNRYDGYGFTVFRHDPRDSTTISENYVWSIIED
ncbi:MAG TPA: two-component regulator propeller domain-containing protein, partial [bacterium]|nr:two-component regulator propeller domain-containing protein [bacterium]